MEFDPKWLTDPQVFQVNRLPAHASYMVRGADGAPLEQTLDGAWKFFMHRRRAPLRRNFTGRI